MSYARQLSAAQRQYESESAYDEAQELAGERRDQYIADFAPAVAARILTDEDDCWGYAVDLSADAQADVMQEAGKFFARFHAAKDNDAMAQAGHALYRLLLPYMEAAAKEQAESEVAAEYDRSMAA